jgi:hypothetical protein
MNYSSMFRITCDRVDFIENAVFECWSLWVNEVIFRKSASRWQQPRSPIVFFYLHGTRILTQLETISRKSTL